MLQKFANDNYNIIQEHIKEAMQKGKHCIYVGCEDCRNDFKSDWVCNDSTVEKLREDGFDVHSYSYDQWEISW